MLDVEVSRNQRPDVPTEDMVWIPGGTFRMGSDHHYPEEAPAFERADITSNTFWDWQMNHVGAIYGAMDEVFQFVATFKDFPPRSFPPSFNPANIMESIMDTIKQKKALTESLDLDRIRGNLNRMIDQQIQQRGVK